MPSVLTPTAFLLREEEGGGGGLIREENLIKKFNLQMGGLLERGGLLELLRYIYKTDPQIERLIGAEQ